MTHRQKRDDPVEAAVAHLRPRLPFRPRVGLILGSGLGIYADRHPSKLAIDYADIPGFPPCTVEGHRGRLVFSAATGTAAVFMQGRIHRYEGRSLEEVTRPVRILGALGIDTLILSCAAGALADIPAGQLMLIHDHLNLMGDNPLIGLSRELNGVDGFVEMARAYDPSLLDLAESHAASLGVPLRRGVLACVTGPTYETPAEAAMLRRLGADAVSMSTVPEVIVARALRLRVMAFALITNQAGVPVDARGSHRAVVATAERMTEKVADFLDGFLARVVAPPESSTGV